MQVTTLWKNVGKCNELNVHEKVMERSSVERYLGDYINQSAKLSSTISHRRAKGYAIVSDILSILRDIPSEKRRVQIGLQLRSAWFISSILKSTTYNLPSANLYSITCVLIERLN